MRFIPAGYSAQFKNDKTKHELLTIIALGVLVSISLLLVLIVDKSLHAGNFGFTGLILLAIAGIAFHALRLRKRSGNFCFNATT